MTNWFEKNDGIEVKDISYTQNTQTCLEYCFRRTTLMRNYAVYCMCIYTLMK